MAGGGAQASDSQGLWVPGRGALQGEMGLKGG